MSKKTLILILGLSMLMLVAACSPSGPSPFTNDSRSYLQSVRLEALELREQELTVAGIPSITIWDCNDPQRAVDVSTDVTPTDQYYVALGLLDPSDDLGTLTQSTIPSSFALFELNSGDIFWMLEACEQDEYEGFTTLEEAVYMRAFIVGMQHRNLNLRGVLTAGRVNSDYALAVRALSAGDAALVTEEYLAGLEGVDEAEIEAASIVNYANELVTEDSADFYRELVTFDYLNGMNFIEAVREVGGWAAVDDAYENRPRSSEHILHPDRFLAEDEPLDIEIISFNELFGVEGQMNLSQMSDNLTGGDSSSGGLAGGGGLDTGGDDVVTTDTETEDNGDDAEATPEAEEIVGWQLIREDVVGEFMLRQHLGVYLDEETVDTAATGWGGDAIEMYYNGTTDERAWMLRLAMDTPDDLTELVDAYLTLLATRTGAEGVSMADGSVCFAGDGETICINQNSAEFYPADEEAVPAEVVIAAAPSTDTAMGMIDIQRDVDES